MAKYWSALLCSLCLGLAMPNIATAAPVRIATANYSVPGEVDVRFVDAVTADDGSLYVLTSGLALSQPRLRLTRWNVNGLRNWSKTINVPSIPVGSAGAMKQASLLALPSGSVLVLSQRNAPIETPLVTVDMVARIFNPAGAQVATRGIAPINKAEFTDQYNFSDGQATLANDGKIWILTNGWSAENNPLTGTLASFHIVCFNSSLVPEYSYLRYGFTDLVNNENEVKGFGITPIGSAGVALAYQYISRLFGIFGNQSSTEHELQHFTTDSRPVSLLSLYLLDTFGPGYASFLPSYNLATTGDNTLTSVQLFDSPFNALLGTDSSTNTSTAAGSVFLAGSVQRVVSGPVAEGKLFVVGGIQNPNEISLFWGGNAGSPDFAFDNDHALHLPAATPAQPWLLDSLASSTDGTVYVAGGYQTGGKESIGVELNYDSTAIPTGITWQLTNASGSFVPKRLLPTTQNRVFAVGVNASGVIGMQLFQQPTYYRGIMVPVRDMSPGQSNQFKIVLAQPAPAGGYRVTLTYPAGRMSGDTTVIVPEGEKRAFGNFTVLPAATLGEATITSRVDNRYDTVNATHTATVVVTY